MAAPASNGLSTITGELFSADNESLSFSAAALAKLVAEAPAADPADEADEEALRAGDASRADKILAKADRSSAAIRAIIAKIEDARATARARASRFDEQYAEPRWETFLTKKEILRLVRQRERAPESGECRRAHAFARCTHAQCCSARPQRDETPCAVRIAASRRH